MCGRYTLVVSMEELMERYLSDQPMDRYHTPRYNIAPMQEVLAVVNDGQANRLGWLRWGLVPHWASDPKIGSGMINARLETLQEKPAFRRLLPAKRCIIPADGYYEWKTSTAGTASTGTRVSSKGSKQPMRIVRRDGGILSLAGLYDTWVSPEGSRLSTCTIITIPPHPNLAPIHDRMPAILRREDEQLWLRRELREPQRLLSLLTPSEGEHLRAYPVGRQVGQTGNDIPECIDEIVPEPRLEQLELDWP